MGYSVLAYELVIVGNILQINRYIMRGIHVKYELESEIEARKSVEEELRILSRVDKLTGLVNRRYFDEVLERELMRATRDRTSLCLIFIDVDYFKPFNDVYGHTKGDDCLEELGKLLKSIVKRQTDTPARYGGEELAVILPNTELADATGMAEAIRLGVEMLAIPHQGSKVGEKSIVTISAGVVGGIPVQEVNKAAFVQQADKALYRAKAEGRNCVIGEQMVLPT